MKQKFHGTVVSRDEALALGARHFFTGQPCRNGHIERRFTKSRHWEKANPDKVYVRRSRRRAREMAAAGAHTAADVRRIFTMQRERCALCKAKLTWGTKRVDHIMPLARGGSNEARNLQILCEPCNAAKGARHPIDFARQKGLLL